MRDLCPFKGGTGGAAGAKHPLTVTKQDLAVGADVDDQQLLVLGIGCFGHQHADIVRTDMASFTRRNMEIGPHCNAEI